MKLFLLFAALLPLVAALSLRNTPARAQRVVVNLAQRSAPTETYTGYIQLNLASGGPPKYISYYLSRYGEFLATTAISQALAVSFNYTAAGTPLSFRTTNDASFPYLGAIESTTSTGSDLGSGSANSLIFGGAALTGPNQLPAGRISNTVTTATGRSVTTETSIWAFDPSSNTITLAYYTNSDGSHPAVTVGYIPGNGGTIVATGDVASYQASNNGTLQVATMSLVQAQRSVPPGTYTGIIQATSTSGGPTRYISYYLSRYGEYLASTAVSQALGFSFNYTAAGTPFSLRTTVTGSTLPYLCVIESATSSSSNLGIGSPNSLSIGGAAVPTVPNQIPGSDSNTITTATGRSATVETSVFALDPSSNAVTILYTNSDGSHPAVTIGYTAINGGTFVITGDAASWEASNSAALDIVTLSLVQPPS